MAATTASPGASGSSDPPGASFPLPPPPADGSSTGALWTAGLGAFLLVAAAATFVAVRWDEIPSMAKFVALIVLTDLCLVAHRRLRDTLPVTATAVFHLGVLLVPIDVAAVGARLEWAWPTMVLAQGLAATVTFGLAAITERSIVLRGAAWLGAVGLAAGIGATTGAPAGLVLAGIALAAAVAHRQVEDRLGDGDRRLGLEWGAAGWAVLAGLAVPLSGAAELGWPAAGVLTDLGLAGQAPHPAAAATGLVAALALGVIAHRHRSLPIALVAVASGLTGVVTTWVGLEPSVPASLAAGAALCLLAQAAAWAWRADAFWHRPTLVLAKVSELVAAGFMLGLLGVLLVAPYDPSASPTIGLAAALIAVTWLMAEAHLQRLAGSGTTPPVPGLAPLPLAAVAAPLNAAVAASAAVTLFTGSGAATAVALTATGVVLVLLAPAVSASWPVRGGGHQVLAAHLLAWAPFAGQRQPGLAAGLAIVGAVAVAEAAVQVTWTQVTPGQANRIRALDTVLALLSLVPLGAGALVLATAGEEGALAAGGAAIVAWFLAIVLDRAEEPPAGQPPLAIWARAGVLVPLVFLSPLPSNQEALVAGVIAVLALVDAVRRDEPLLLVGTGIALPFTLQAMAQTAGWTMPEASVALVLSGVAWLGVGACLPDRWAPPAVISAAIAATFGLGLGLGDPAMLATDLLLVGGALTAAGLVVDRIEMTALGLTMAAFGLWSHLALAHVTASEPYVAPVAALLLATGIYAQRNSQDASSWLAYAPSIVLLGGSALLERLDGGPSWHALIAGAVGVAAVAVGGARRLAGPLLVGTTLVVAVTIHETLGVTAGLPTWVWLAAGGSALLGAGVAMERRGVGPVETGRRLLDVIDERFT